MSNEIGGYFELELRHGHEYHRNAIALNTARNSLEYILRAEHFTKVYIPYYNCSVMLEPMQKCNVDYEYYHIDGDFDPADEPRLDKHEAFLYTNYFGLKQATVEKLTAKYGGQLIVDNSQAFFAKPLNGICTFYSPRKFFGVADGSYLYTNNRLNEAFDIDTSYQRMLHLLKRADTGPNSGFDDFHSNEASLINQNIRLMSTLTHKILASIDYEAAIRQRNENYDFLHAKLHSINMLHLHRGKNDVPMAYPLFTENRELKAKLIANKIFVATYWPNVLEQTTEQSVENIYANRLLALPIDQRYNKDCMNDIANKILTLTK